MINTKYIGKKVLVTCNAYFVGPDGKDHRAVWGTLDGIYTDKDFDFKAASGMANWAYDIGGVIIMGCQVRYFCLCEKNPGVDIESFTQKDQENIIIKIPNGILITK